MLRSAAQVIVRTTHSALEGRTKFFTKFQANVVAMDEARRAVPSELFIVLRMMKMVIMAGKIHQLKTVVPQSIFS